MAIGVSSSGAVENGIARIGKAMSCIITFNRERFTCFLHVLLKFIHHLRVNAFVFITEKSQYRSLPGFSVYSHLFQACRSTSLRLRFAALPVNPIAKKSPPPKHQPIEAISAVFPA